MSYNGSGTFNINTSGQPVVAGTVITATAFNLLTADLATGLTTAMTKDGQTTTTARIPFAQGISSTLVTDATNTTSGSIITDGGVGIAKALYVGTTANVGSTTDSSSISTGSIVTAGGVGIAKNLYVGGTLNVTGSTSLTNPVINNIKMGYTTTATAAGTTTLTVSSNYRQFFTGTTTQTIVLPVTSTLVTGIAYEIENNSTGTLTVNSSGGNLVGTIPSGVCAHAVCIGTTLTTAADWDWDYISTTTITGTGANVLGTSPTLVTPILGTPQSGTLTNCTGLPNAGLVNSSITIGGTAIALGASSSTITNDITINTVVVGKGGGNDATSVCVGSSTLSASNTGTDNNAFGVGTLLANTTGSSNSGFGRAALRFNTTGSQNVAFGSNALIANTTGSNNISLGWYANNFSTTGSYITAIGYNSYPNAVGDTNELIISCVTGGTGGKGTNTGFITVGTGGMYQGNNSLSWSVTSDQRLKKNIVDNNNGLDIINQIQVRNFEYRLPEEVTELPLGQAIQKQGVQLGVIAQELQQILPECVKTESTGVMTVDADNLTWYLINAVKELSARIKQLEGN